VKLRAREDARLKGADRSAELDNTPSILVHRSTAYLLSILGRREILIFLCFEISIAKSQPDIDHWLFNRVVENNRYPDQKSKKSRNRNPNRV
jgi:hypothetical protein